MRAFTLTTPGIQCRDGKILLGEEGRGRQLAVVPVPAGGTFEGDKLVALAVPGEGLNEVLLEIPDVSGFRGSSSSTAQAGAVQIAQGYCADGIAGRMGGGSDTLYRVADGGTVVVHRGGRRVEWTEARFTNVGGQIVLRIPAEEAAKEAAMSALFGTAPVISADEADSTRALEAARVERDRLAAEAQAAGQRRTEEIQAETARLQHEAWNLERQVANVRAEAKARERVERAKTELGNGMAGKFAALGL